MIPPLNHGLVDVSLVVLGRPLAAGGTEGSAWAQSPVVDLHPVAAALLVLVAVVAANGWRHWRRRPRPTGAASGG